MYNNCCDLLNLEREVQNPWKIKATPSRSSLSYVSHCKWTLRNKSNQVHLTNKTGREPGHRQICSRNMTPNKSRGLTAKSLAPADFHIVSPLELCCSQTALQRLSSSPTCEPAHTRCRCNILSWGCKLQGAPGSRLHVTSWCGSVPELWRRHSGRWCRSLPWENEATCWGALWACPRRLLLLSCSQCHCARRYTPGRQGI